MNFVKDLGAYKDVYDYEGLESIEPDVPNLYVDFTGKQALRDRVHKHFGASLTYDCLVRSTQADSFLQNETSMGIKPIFFFAADVLDRHRRENTLRHFLNRFEADQLAFFQDVMSAKNPWINITERNGLKNAKTAISDLLITGSNPAKGHVITLR